MLAHVLFWLLVNPVNAAFAAWTPAAVPADWTRLRDQWEFTHAARGGLFLLGFGALLGRCWWVPGQRARRRTGQRPGKTTG